MDKDGNGCIEPSEVMDCYDTSKHPDVMSGKKTPQEVRRRRARARAAPPLRGRARSPDARARAAPAAREDGKSS